MAAKYAGLSGEPGIARFECRARRASADSLSAGRGYLSGSQGGDAKAEAWDLSRLARTLDSLSVVRLYLRADLMAKRQESDAPERDQ